MNKQKDRLVELLRALMTAPEVACPRYHTDEDCKGCQFDKGDSCDIAGREADYILADGWMRPPVKIGQELWDIHYNKPRKWEVVYLGYNGKEWHINIHWWKDRHNFKTLSITYPFIGKEWYLTKEEAEAKLKEGVQGC